MASPRRRPSFGKEPETRFRDLDHRYRRFLLGAVVTLITSTVLFVYLLPFGYMASTSLKTEDQISESTILPRTPRTHEYALVELDLVELTGSDGGDSGFTLLPLGGSDTAATTVAWNGSWDQVLSRLDGEDIAELQLFSAGSGRSADRGVTVLRPTADAAILSDSDVLPTPLAFDGSEGSLDAALAATGYSVGDVSLFSMPDTSGENPALALLRPGSAINALVDPALLPAPLDWDRTFPGLEAIAEEMLAAPLTGLELHTVRDADGSLNGVGILAEGADPAIFIDPAVVPPEAIAWNGDVDSLTEILDTTFSVEPRELPLRRVPLPDGTTRTLALLEVRPESSVFVDPDDESAEPIVWEGRIQTTGSVLDFDPRFDNYPDAWDALDFTRRLRNTAVIAGLGMAGTVLASTLVAYGLSRFRIRFKGLILGSLVATIILPRFVTLVPTYIVYQRIGWVGTWWPLILPHFFANAYNVFLLRQFFLTIPRDLDEAAAIDGAGPMRTLLTVILPQAKGAILAVALFHFFFSWNDFLEPLLYLVSEPELQPISIGLYFFIGIYDSNVPLIQSGAMLGMAVPILVFLVLQRVFLRGINLSGAVK